MTATELLSSEGPFAQEWAAFEPRQGQQRLAEAIEATLAQRGILVAEAATGTGKTLAYLTPVLEGDASVLISTGTRNLQEQLYFRDIPAVRETLSSGARVAMLKGRSNYLCRYRMDQARGEADRRSPDFRRHLGEVQRWAQKTKYGDIAELRDLPEDSPVWPQVTSTADNCLGGDCPMYDECHVVKARREAMRAQVVVVNHHLLFADMALKEEGFGEVLPTVDAVIVDEAHQVPDVATRFFSTALSTRQIYELARDSQKEAAETSGGLHQVQPAVGALEQALRELQLAFDKARDRSPLGEILADQRRVGALDDLDAALDELAAQLQPLAEASPGLGKVHKRANDFRARLRLLQTGDDEHVRWFEARARGFALHATPLTIDDAFTAIRERLRAAWVYCSATLAVAGRFDHYLQRLGLDDARTLTVASPFDFEHNTLLWLPENLPQPNQTEHTETLLRTVQPLLRASRGRAFLLFTAHRALRRAAEWLREHTDFELFVQGEAPRADLLERFRAADNGLLLGAASFWEGVDVAGEALSVVVIDKLPFAAPDDPVLKARGDAIRDAGGNPFSELSLPEAVLSLKQGVGRLIRGRDDRGVVVLGDPRLLTKGYGRVFIKSLPPLPLIRSADDAVAFFEDHTMESTP